jgi:drug/metabolite transporter (DMT)-like permease
MFWFPLAFLAAFSSATVAFLSKRRMKHVSYYMTSWALLTLSMPFFLVLLLFVEIPALGQWFWPAVLTHVVLFLISIVLYMKALQASDLSLTLPMLAFSPIFMLVTGPLINGEFPAAQALAGIFAIVFGAYLLSFDRRKHGLLAPLRALLSNKGTSLMLIVSLFWAIMASTSKLAVTESSPVFALAATYILTALFSTLGFALTGHLNFRAVRANSKGLALIGFLTFLGNIGLYYAFTMTLAVHAIAVKRLSILLGSLYGFAFFKEKHIGQRLGGVALMLAGVALVTL